MLTYSQKLVVISWLTLANGIKVSIKPESTTISLGELPEIKISTYRSKDVVQELNQDSQNFLIGDLEACETGKECKITQLVHAHGSCGDSEKSCNVELEIHHVPENTYTSGTIHFKQKIVDNLSTHKTPNSSVFVERNSVNFAWPRLFFDDTTENLGYYTFAGMFAGFYFTRWGELFDNHTFIHDG